MEALEDEQFYEFRRSQPDGFIDRNKKYKQKNNYRTGKYKKSNWRIETNNAIKAHKPESSSEAERTPEPYARAECSLKDLVVAAFWKLIHSINAVMSSIVMLPFNQA